jgi:hypothetical protein
VVAAFVKGDPSKAASLVANIQKLTEKHSGLRPFVVFTGGPELKPQIEKVGAEKGIKIPLTFLPGGTGDGAYQRFKVNPEAQNTVLLYSRQRVHANFVNVDASKWGEVEKAAAAMLGQ